MIRKLSTLTHSTQTAGQAILDFEHRHFAAYLPFIGPAIIASVAYMDPGNFATNIQAGSQFGYNLLWVVLLANLVAMLFQSLSAKLGIVTGKSLAENCRTHLSPILVYPMWLGSEVAAIATDLAEVLGAAVAITLLFNLPLFASCLVVGLATYVILLLEGTGFRPMEIAIGSFVGIIGLSYIVELFIAPPNIGSAIYHLLIPSISGPESILLAAGIVGATVMPHAIFLHSSLTAERIKARNDSDRKQLIRFSNHEVIVALGMAGLVNIAMIAMSAGVFHYSGNTSVASIETAFQTLTPLLGKSAAIIFLISLLASGFSSSVVGTMAGQRIMQDFVNFKVPLFIRRFTTLFPVFVVVYMGYSVTQSLVMSQVILSLTLPIPTISLLYLTSKKEIMSNFANSKKIIFLSSVSVIAILLLNLVLLGITFGFI